MIKQKLKLWWDDFVFIVPSFGLGLVVACIFFFAGVFAGSTPSIYIATKNEDGEWYTSPPISPDRLEYKITHLDIGKDAYVWEPSMKGYGWMKITEYDRAKAIFDQLPPSTAPDEITL